MREKLKKIQILIYTSSHKSFHSLSASCLMFKKIYQEFEENLISALK